MMDRKELKARRRYLAEENRRFQSWKFVEIPREERPEIPSSIPIIKVLRSREFLVVVYGGMAVRLTICRTELNDRGDYRDGITWDELWAIKNGCGFAEADAVEIYPRQSDTMNVTNMRHLWIVAANQVPFAWRPSVRRPWKSGHVANELEGFPIPGGSVALDATGNNAGMKV
jgi:hypothetical protein